MYVDALTRVWNAAALTADAASTSSYDTGQAGGNDVSVGEPLVCALTVGVAADHTTGDETYQFNFIQSATADLGTPDILATIPFTAAQYALLAAGATLGIPVPMGSITKRYIGLYFDGGGTTPTITVTAWFTPWSMVQKAKTFPTSIVVL